MQERKNSEVIGIDSIIKISVVIPVYNEEQSVNELYQKIVKVFEKNQTGYEIVFIDDGSTDSTFQKIGEISRIDNHIKIIKFRKNFGKSIALNVAFGYVRGSIIITMDGDLQDDPEEIPNFISKIEDGYDLVSGWKYPRNDPFTKTIPSLFFNKLTCFFTGVNLHDFNCGFKAYRKRAVKDLRLYGEMHRYIPALVVWNGYTITEIKIRHHARSGGTSKYGVSRLVKGLLDLITVKFITEYSARPLHVFGFLGMISLFIGIVLGIFLVLQRFVENIRLGDRPLLLLSVALILIGLQFISLGLIGEMLTFREMREKNPDRYIDVIVE